MLKNTRFLLEIEVDDCSTVGTTGIFKGLQLTVRHEV